MATVFTIVTPVFALIVLGYSAGRFGWIGRDAAKGLTDFTFTIAVPAMLFRAMAKTELPATGVQDIWLAFFGAAIVVWGLSTLATRWLIGRPALDAPSISMSASFGNVVMLGIPLSLSAFGPTAAAPAALIVALHSPLLWLLATAHMAVARSGDAAAGAWWSLLKGLVLDLSRNVIILAILAGLCWRATGLELLPVIAKLVGLLAQAGVPCALMALGLSLVGFEIKGQSGTLALILVLKLVAMPAIAALLAAGVFGLAPVSAGVVILFAAMPTGANAYLFASRSNRAANSASGAVALSTVLSAATASAIIYVLK
ncbi:MAG: AEC family transporter [Hyphomicrobiaceae bacterium]|nr:AEC family transporter [Hyphomicrobiaceae bacterium]